MQAAAYLGEKKKLDLGQTISAIDVFRRAR